MNFLKILQILSIIFTLPITGIVCYIFYKYTCFCHVNIFPKYNCYFIKLVVIFSFCFLAIFFARIISKKNTKINIKEGILIVLFTWIVITLIGTIPYLLAGFSLVNAFFESASGISTTGSTIITDVSILPKDLLLWRAGSQWLGGMGIIVFFVSILPTFGQAGRNLFNSEIPGPVKSSLTPHIYKTSQILWILYFSLTAFLAILYTIFGMSFYDAVCHAFTTMSTGGFSTFNSSFIELNRGLQWIAIIFMFLGGVNFGLYYLGFFQKNRFLFWKDFEFRNYFFVLVTFIVILSLGLFFFENYDLEKALRTGAFQTLTTITTTGYTNDNYENYLFFLQAIIFFIMFFGGSSGSTAGGIKIFRVTIILKAISEEFKKLFSKNLISHIKIEKDSILSENIVKKIFIFVFIYFSTIFIGSLILFSLGIDFVTAFSAAVTSVGNVGPGFGSIGPTENFNHFPDAAKYIFSVLMLMGRLEFFTVLAVFHPAFWSNK